MSRDRWEGGRQLTHPSRHRRRFLSLDKLQSCEVSLRSFQTNIVRGEKSFNVSVSPVDSLPCGEIPGSPGSTSKDSTVLNRKDRYIFQYIGIYLIINNSGGLLFHGL